MTGDTAVQGEAIAEEGEVEYISDDDEEEEENRYVTDRIILPSPRVSVEEREVSLLPKLSPVGTDCPMAYFSDADYGAEQHQL